MESFPQYRLDNPPQQPQEEAASRNRRPQLNEKICGNRCGCGCRVLYEDDGEGSDGGTSVTLVESDAPSVSEEPLPGLEMDDMVESRLAVGRTTPIYLEETQSGTGEAMPGPQSWQHSWHETVLEDTPTNPQSSEHCEDETESLCPEPCATGDHSSVAPESARISTLSPGLGIPTWADTNWTQEVQLVYHFDVRPLRLVPQLRHCRGKVASHLVTQDVWSLTAED